MNAYEAEAGTVRCCLQVKLRDSYLSAFGVSHDKAAIQIHIPLPLALQKEHRLDNLPPQLRWWM